MAGLPINVTQYVTTLAHDTNIPNTWQAGQESLDVSAYNGARFEFSLKVFALTGTGTPTATIKLITSMYNDDENANWQPLGEFESVGGGNKVKVFGVASDVLRYVKWTAEFTTTTMISFEILGMAW